MNTNSEIAAAALKDGTTTSEYAVTQSAGAWGVALLVCGVITTVLLDLLNALKASKDISGSETGHTIIVVGGILMALAGAVMKAITAASYSQSRGLVKAAAVRDVDLTPATAAPVATPPAV
jgi:regulator of RNase E activity RraA